VFASRELMLKRFAPLQKSDPVNPTLKFMDPVDLRVHSLPTSDPPGICGSRARPLCASCPDRDR
jgi:hypothetical protein